MTTKLTQSTQMSTNATDAEGWTQAKPKPKSKPKTWSIDRDRKPEQRSDDRKQGSNSKPFRTKSSRDQSKRLVKEKIPDVVAQVLVNEVLSLVGDSDWNDPSNVSKTIAGMMSIDLNSPVEGQVPTPVEIDRTVFVPAKKGSDIPFWVVQSFIRVDEKFGNRYIEYKGAKYNKLDIIFENEYFKRQLDLVAKSAHCTWNYRWGNAKKEENRLYQKTRTGAKSDESWLERCVKPLITDKDVDGINIKNLVMIEFHRDLRLLNTQ